MSKRLNFRNPSMTGAFAFALSASLLLSACQTGGSDVPTDKDIDDAARDQQTQVQSNTDASQGGAVVNAGDGTTQEGGNGESNASTKTGFDDLWMLDSVSMSDGTTLYDDQDVLYYGTTYETVLALQFSDAEDGEEKIFAATLPGVDLIGSWEETSETHADLSIPISDTETMTGSCDMSEDYQTAELRIDSDDGTGVIYSFHRDDDTTITLDSMYEAMVKNNDDYYDGLSVDVASDVTFVDDDNIQMRLLGTTHGDGLVGYLIEVTNKTSTPFIINDFIADEGALFTVNGTTQTKPLLGRVLPPAVVDEETGEQMVAPMRCAILFSTDDVGDTLSSAFGNIIVTDFHWNEVGRYQFTMNQ